MSYKNLPDYFKPIDLTYTTMDVGQEFNSYKDMCLYLCQPICTGGAKRNQIDNFERYFEWVTHGYKITITNIYDKPLFNINNAVYSSIIQKLMLDILARDYLHTNNKSGIYSYRQIIEGMSMVNQDFYKYKYDHSKLVNELEVETPTITIGDVAEYYKLTLDKMVNSVDNAMKRLKNKVLIDFDDVKILKFEDENNFVSVRIATTEEREDIVQAEKLAIDDMGVGSISEVIYKGLWKEFNRVSILKLKEINNKYNRLEYYYKAFRIYFNEFILREIDSLEKFILGNKSEVKDVLNQNIVDGYKESYHDRYDTAIELLSDNHYAEFANLKNWKKEQVEFRAGENYIKNGHALIDKTIKK